jgi:hypothetical protein
MADSRAVMFALAALVFGACDKDVGSDMPTGGSGGGGGGSGAGGGPGGSADAPQGSSVCQPACGQGQRCVNSSCVPCGGAGQTCCDDDMSTGCAGAGAGHACGPAGTCVPCGGMSQPCCDGDSACQAPLGCIDGPGTNDTCGVCGGNGQGCCTDADEPCEARHRCLAVAQGQPKMCRPCGAADQPCCIGQMPCQAPLGCQKLPNDADMCAACGEMGQRCCSGTGARCTGNLMCVSPPMGDTEICQGGS